MPNVRPCPTEGEVERLTRELAESRAQIARAWDQGHAVGWTNCQDGNYGTDYWDDETPNPYRRVDPSEGATDA